MIKRFKKLAEIGEYFELKKEICITALSFTAKVIFFSKLNQLNMIFDEFVVKVCFWNGIR